MSPRARSTASMTWPRSSSTPRPRPPTPASPGGAAPTPPSSATAWPRSARPGPQGSDAPGQLPGSGPGRHLVPAPPPLPGREDRGHPRRGAGGGGLPGLRRPHTVPAGTGHREHGRLAYLSNQDAAAVRAQLLALAHGLAAETPEPPAHPLFRVDNGRLIAASLLRGTWLLVLVVVAGGAILAAVDPAGGGGTVRQGGAEAATSLISAVVTGLVALGLDAARSVNGDFDFTIGQASDGLRLHRGLLQKRHETIPYGRIQAVRLIQPLLWRPFGWARVELDVARQPEARHQGEARQLAHLLAPVATLDQARWLVAQVAPGAPATLARAGAPPRPAPGPATPPPPPPAPGPRRGGPGIELPSPTTISPRGTTTAGW